jgi:hypothetical protein
MNTARRLYTLLLMLYPRSYRTAFGEQMMQTFIDHYTDVATSAGRVRIDFWLFMVSDEIKNIARQQIVSLREGRRLRPAMAAKMAVTAVLLIPLFAACYATLVTAVLAAPHPAVSGLSFLIALAALVLLSGIFSAATSYALAGLVLRALPKRTMRAV